MPAREKKKGKGGLWSTLLSLSFSLGSFDSEFTVTNTNETKTPITNWEGVWKDLFLRYALSYFGSFSWSWPACFAFAFSAKRFVCLFVCSPISRMKKKMDDWPVELLYDIIIKTVKDLGTVVGCLEPVQIVTWYCTSDSPPSRENINLSGKQVKA